jgi:hypothetical protein
MAWLRRWLREWKNGGAATMAMRTITRFLSGALLAALFLPVMLLGQERAVDFFNRGKDEASRGEVAAAITNFGSVA